MALETEKRKIMVPTDALPSEHQLPNPCRGAFSLNSGRQQRGRSSLVSYEDTSPLHRSPTLVTHFSLVLSRNTIMCYSWSEDCSILTGEGKHIRSCTHRTPSSDTRLQQWVSMVLSNHWCWVNECPSRKY